MNIAREPQTARKRYECINCTLRRFSGGRINIPPFLISVLALFSCHGDSFFPPDLYCGSVHSNEQRKKRNGAGKWLGWSCEGHLSIWKFLCQPLARTRVAHETIPSRSAIFCKAKLLLHFKCWGVPQSVNPTVHKGMVAFLLFWSSANICPWENALALQTNTSAICLEKPTPSCAETDR